MRHRLRRQLKAESPPIRNRVGGVLPFFKDRMRACWLCAGILAAATAAPSEAPAQDTEWNRYTLEDLGGVFIRLEADEACEAAGVTASSYEADVSLRLIEHEVGVLTLEEMLEHPALPELRISLACASSDNGSGGIIAYSVGLRVQQAAQMLRDTQITLPEAVTWYSTEVGVSSTGSVVDDIGATLMTRIDAFAAAWSAIHEGGSR